MKIQLRPRAGGMLRCAVCHSTEAGWQICPRCRTRVHAACRAWLARCPTLGCGERGRVRIEVPRAPEGQHDFVVTVCSWLLGMFVLGLVGLLSMTAVPRTDVARISLRADFKFVGDAVTLFRVDHGRYPRSLSELCERRPEAGDWAPEAGDWAGWDGIRVPPRPYLSEGSLRDPWGGPYRYLLAEGQHPVLITLGADSAPGGVGDAADVRYDVVRECIDCAADAHVAAPGGEGSTEGGPVGRERVDQAADARAAAPGRGEGSTEGGPAGSSRVGEGR